MEWDVADRSAGANYHFMTSAVAPRPIAWVTSVSADGTVNAAPFSWFQSVCADPPLVMLALADRSGGGPKDTLANIEATQEFVVNLATAEQVDDIVASSAEFPPEESEVEAVGLETRPSVGVSPPRLVASPVHMECRLVETRRYGGDKGTTMIVGEVVHIGADDEVLDGRGNVDPHKVAFLARLGGRYYTAVRDVFEHDRPASR